MKNYIKVLDVINSCTNKKQLTTATRYANLALEKLTKRKRKLIIVNYIVAITFAYTINRKKTELTNTPWDGTSFQKNYLGL